MAIKEVANRLLGKDTEELFADMGETWDYMMADPQLRWCGLHLQKSSNYAFFLPFRLGSGRRKVSFTSHPERSTMQSGTCMPVHERSLYGS